eukprot:7354606-Heterocapsa_arctica.AAC.2
MPDERVRVRARGIGGRPGSRSGRPRVAPSPEEGGSATPIPPASVRASSVRFPKTGRGNLGAEP